MGSDNNKLDDLWHILKDYRHKFNKSYSGLLRVDFNIPLDVFKRDYEFESRIYNVKRALVKESVDDVLDILLDEKNEVHHHHLTCAANMKGVDSALCIHYKDLSSGNIYSVALTGVNYYVLKEMGYFVYK